MKVTLLTVGRLGRSSEAGLALDYAQRASASGRALGLGPFDLIEVEDFEETVPDSIIILKS